MVGFKPLKSNQVPNGKNDRMTLAGGYNQAQKETK
jgi:hypothetical protein